MISECGSCRVTPIIIGVILAVVSVVLGAVGISITICVVVKSR